jgi:hypothetical protein
LYIADVEMYNLEQEPNYMIFTPKPIYEQDSARGERLHDKLNAVHASLDSDNGVTAVRSTIVGDWSVSLITGEDGNLVSAAATSLGSDTYSFERTGEKTWAATNSQHNLFEEAHFLQSS